MTTMAEIQAVCDQIAEKFHPEKIILFGSQAYGEPTWDSDVDLLILMEFEGKSVYQSVEIRLAVHFPFPVDLVLRRPADAKQRYEQYDPLIRDAFNHGKVLYDKGGERVA